MIRSIASDAIKKELDALVAGDAASSAEEAREDTEDGIPPRTSYDYIIIGAGPGCVSLCACMCICVRALFGFACVLSLTHCAHFYPCAPP